MTLTITIPVDSLLADSRFYRWNHISQVLRRLASDAAYAGIYDTSEKRLLTEPVQDSQGNTIATITLED